MWLTENRIDTALIDPGKPWQNGTSESFNGKFRDEYLSLEWFRSRREASIIIEAWRRHFNAVRPHMSLNYLTPTEFKQHHQAESFLQPETFARNKAFENSQAGQNTCVRCFPTCLLISAIASALSGTGIAFRAFPWSG